ncbi:hypothetical protein [Paraburkholderia sp. BR10936]|uniref:hypothetical protein n=1 Tax=Paraburkholderia sp. BR10936 TaxID=3236993 RepID=UPI0034D1F8EA
MTNTIATAASVSSGELFENIRPLLALPFKRIADATVHDEPCSVRFKSPLNCLDVHDLNAKPSDRAWSMPVLAAFGEFQSLDRGIQIADNSACRGEGAESSLF